MNNCKVSHEKKKNNLNEVFYLFSIALASCSSFNCEWKLKNNEYIISAIVFRHFLGIPTQWLTWTFQFCEDLAMLERNLGWKTP